jgi:hypothetical protein
VIEGVAVKFKLLEVKIPKRKKFRSKYGVAIFVDIITGEIFEMLIIKKITVREMNKKLAKEFK